MVTSQLAVEKTCAENVAAICQLNTQLPVDIVFFRLHGVIIKAAVAFKLKATQKEKFDRQFIMKNCDNIEHCKLMQTLIATIAAELIIRADVV